jgi:cell division transport system permease protein
MNISFLKKLLQYNSNEQNQLHHIFPESAERKRMSFVFAGLACLISLSLLAISAGITASKHWGSAFEETYVLELRPVAEKSRELQLETAENILSRATYVDSYQVITQQEMTKLMAPWLGDELIINELPLSQLIKIVIGSHDIQTALETLKADITQIPGASIEGYHRAKTEYKSAAHAIKLISLSTACLLLLITAAVTAISVESGVLDNKKIINIIRLIGTDNKLITHLFIQSILVRALKGAFAGMIIACAVLAFISLLGAVEGLGVPSLFSSFVPGFDVLIMLLIVPLTMITVGYYAGKKTMNNLIKSFI